MGTVVAFDGLLTDAGAPAPWKRLALVRAEPKPAKGLAFVTTDGEGRFHHELAVTDGGTFEMRLSDGRAVSGGGAGARAAPHPPGHPPPACRRRARPARARLGRSRTCRSVILDVHRRRADGGWRRIARWRVRLANGAFDVQVPVPSSGRYRVRVSAAQEGRLVATPPAQALVHIRRVRDPGTAAAAPRSRCATPSGMRPALSVLDLAPVTTATTASDALRHSIDLAQHVERLGYVRHWVAEHHNIPSVASVAPDVLMAHLAAVTSTIRIGSGGVMLPNHAPLAVAERFAHPRRAAPRAHRSRHRPRTGHRRGHRRGAAPPAGRSLRRRLPRGPARRARLPRRRLPGDAPVLPHPGAARRVGRAAAGRLAARLERLQRPARRRPGAALRLRAPLRRAEHAGGARALPPLVHAPACCRSRTP